MQPSLQDLMDPKKIVLQHKYENARHAVIKSYELAARNFNYIEPTKAYKVNEKGEAVRDYDKDIDASPEAVLLHVANCAREIAKEMTKDLNETLKVLEEPTDGVKATHS